MNELYISAATCGWNLHNPKRIMRIGQKGKMLWNIQWSKSRVSDLWLVFFGSRIFCQNFAPKYFEILTVRSGPLTSTTTKPWVEQNGPGPQFWEQNTGLWPLNSRLNSFNPFKVDILRGLFWTAASFRFMVFLQCFYFFSCFSLFSLVFSFSPVFLATNLLGSLGGWLLVCWIGWSLDLRSTRTLPEIIFIRKASQNSSHGANIGVYGIWIVTR